MTSSDLDLRLQRFRSRRDEYPHALASALIDAGRSNDALEVIHLGLLDNESNLELLTLEGRAYYAQGDLQEAQRSLLRAAKVDPRNKEPYRWLAQVLIERGDPARAVQVLERAMALDPTDQTLRQAHTRAQRLFETAGRKEAPAKQPRPSTRASTRPPSAGSATPSGPRDSLGLRSLSERAVPEARAHAGASGGLVGGSRPAASHSAPARGMSELAGRGQALRARARGHDVAQDAIAEDLQREPVTDPGTHNLRAAPRPAGPSRALPFDDETERDDESPTTAVEVPEDLRSYLRGDPPRDTGKPPRGSAAEEARGRPRAAADEPAKSRAPGRVADDFEEEEGSEPTSIVPSERELELLRDRAGAGREGREPASLYDSSEDRGDDTIIDSTLQLAEPGQAEPPEQVLGLLQAQGVFEPPGQSPKTRQAWIPTLEIARAGTPIKRALLVGWGLAVLAAAGGYVGFQSWLDGRRAEAAGQVELASAELFDGQNESLRAAHGRLLAARALDPRSQPALEGLLFAQAMDALDGAGDFVSLRETLARAEQARFEGPLIEAARALARPVEQRKSEGEATLARLDAVTQQDARASLLAGKLAQRVGQVDTQKRLIARATALEPRLALAWLALGEQARAEGQLEQAYEAFDKALGPDRHQLRAELWITVLEAKASESSALLQKLDALTPRVERGSDADKLLALAVRSFAALAAGEGDQARKALAAASALHVDDPEVLVFFSQQALRAGEPALAYRTARAASSAGGDAARYQSIVAAALLQQGKGDAALTALAGLGEGHGALALARASAALLSNAREALEAAKKELASYRVTPVGKDDVEASSLLMRVDIRLGANVESLLPAARSLVARAPGNPASHLALASALIAAGQGTQAVEVLEPALRLSPGAADAHYLLGQAQRLAGRPTEARLSFERAVAIAPTHVEARRALGRTLLDGGEFELALALFRGLEGAADNVATLGIAEALIAKGAVAEAEKQLEALPANVKQSAAAELLRARLALLRKVPLEAVQKLEPLVAEDAESRTADTLALYGDALYAAERVDAAAGAYDAALELDDKHPDALIGRAVTAVRTDRPDQALAFIERADAALTMRVRPPSVRALWLVTAAHADLQKGQVQSARERLGRACALPGTPDECYFWYGEALTKSKDVGASEQYARYLSLAPTGLYAARAKRSLGTR